MAQMGRPGLSASQKSEVWRRWKSGQSHSDIGRALGKHPASIHGIIAANGVSYQCRVDALDGLLAGKSVKRSLEVSLRENRYE